MFLKKYSGNGENTRFIEKQLMIYRKEAQITILLKKK